MWNVECGMWNVIIINKILLIIMNKYLKKLPPPFNQLNTPFNLVLSNLIYQKNVVIVGPSNYLTDMNLGELIDKYQVVVRIKKGSPIPDILYNDYGKKTDILYTNLRMDNNTNSLQLEDLLLMKQQGVQHICYPYPTEKNNLIDYRFRKNWKLNSKKINKVIPIANTINIHDFLLIQQLIQTRPTTGLLAIMDILKYNPKELLVIGFTFRTEWLGKPNSTTNIYHSYYKNNQQLDYTISTTKQVHSIENEWIYFQYLLTHIPKLIYHTK